MRVGVVGGITVGGHSGGMMRQGATIGHSRGGRNMVSNSRSRVGDQRSRVGNQSRCGMRNSYWSMVHGGSALVDDGVEAIVIIGGVLHGAHRTIGLNQGVGALDNITITHLMLRLHIAGVRVSNTIVVVVLGVGLTGKSAREGGSQYQHLLHATRHMQLANKRADNRGKCQTSSCRLTMAYTESCSHSYSLHTYMVVQALVMMSTMSTMAGIGESGARGVQCGSGTVQDTG